MEVDEPAGDVAVAPEQLKPKDQEHVKPPPVTGLEFLDRFEDLADVADRWALITVSFRWIQRGTWGPTELNINK